MAINDLVGGIGGGLAAYTLAAIAFPYAAPLVYGLSAIAGTTIGYKSFSGGSSGKGSHSGH